MDSDKKLISLSVDEASIIVTCLNFTINHIQKEIEEILNPEKDSKSNEGLQKAYFWLEVKDKLDLAELKTDHLMMAESSLIRYQELRTRLLTHIKNNSSE
jgi:hypothetical protein